jgi:hypothetical protein
MIYRLPREIFAENHWTTGKNFWHRKIKKAGEKEGYLGPRLEISSFRPPATQARLFPVVQRGQFSFPGKLWRRGV